MSAIAEAQRRFRGAVVSSEVVVGVFFDVVLVGAERVELRPLLRRGFVLQRGEIAAVECERQWLPPVWVRTVVRFRFTDGTYAPKVVVPIWARSLRGALAAAGWPVMSVPFGSTEPRTVRSLDALRQAHDPRRG